MNPHMINYDVEPSLNVHLKKSNNAVLVLHFWGNFLAQKSRQINDVVDEAINKKIAPIECVLIDVEKYLDIVSQYEVQSVPTCVIICKETEYGRVEGLDNAKLIKLVKEAGFKNFPLQVSELPGEQSNEKLNDRLKSLINQSKVMVFMKGSKEAPRCKFSRELVDILNEVECQYESFDILQDETVRQGLKTYSDWPTYPQVYVEGTFVGGIDIIKELKSMGNLKQTLILE